MYIKKKKKNSSQTKFYMQLNSIKNCRKKEKRKKRKALLVAKNRGLQLNQVKILRIYPIVYKKKNQVKLNFICN